MILCAEHKWKQGYISRTARYIPNSPKTVNTATCFSNSIPVQYSKTNGTIVVIKLKDKFFKIKDDYYLYHGSFDNEGKMVTGAGEKNVLGK